LRLAAIGERSVEHMRAEACFGAVPAGAVAIAEESMQPAVGLLARIEIVDQLDMAVAAGEFPGRKFGDVERDRDARRLFD